MTQKVCGTCEFWAAEECFRFPPQMVLYPSDNQHPIMYAPAPFRPNVSASSPACGEWRGNAAEQRRVHHEQMKGDF